MPIAPPPTPGLPPPPAPGVIQFEPNIAQFGVGSFWIGDPDPYFNPFGYDPGAVCFLNNGNATDYTEIQILRAAFGGAAAIPSSYFMGISLTPIYDNGVGLTEMSGHGYARAPVPVWNDAQVVDQYPNSVVFAQPSADVVFPNPSSPWWAKTNQYGTSTVVYPFLADAASGGNLLWVWTVAPSFVPVHGKPLGFRPSIGFTAVDTGPWLYGLNFGVTNPPGIGGADMPMARKIIDMLTGGASYSPPLPFTINGPLALAVPLSVPLGTMHDPAIDQDGRAVTWNSNPITFPPQDDDVFFANPLYQIVGSDSIAYWQFSGRSWCSQAGTPMTIPTAGVAIKMD